MTDHNGLFPLIKIIKSKKKKLAIISFYWLGQETWLDDSWKLIYINQSRFYNLFYVGKFKNAWHNFKIFFSIFKNKPSANWVVHITRDIFVRYFCLYYNSMLDIMMNYNCSCKWEHWFNLNQGIPCLNWWQLYQFGLLPALLFHKT